MILVDTSIWIEWLRRPPRPALGDRQLANLATCGPVLQEVLQGLRPGPEALAFRDDFLALPVLGDPLATATFLAAADLYRLGRAKGLPIRSSVDCLIAAIALEHRVPVWHRDRDFAALARFTALELYSPP